MFPALYDVLFGRVQFVAKRNEFLLDAAEHGAAYFWQLNVGSLFLLASEAFVEVGILSLELLHPPLVSR